ARAGIVRPDAPDQRQSAETLALHGEVDNHHVRFVTAVAPIPRSRVARLENVVHPDIFENAPASLQHDRMIVDDEDAAHGVASLSGRCTGISIQTWVPRSLSLMTEYSPPSACTRSLMPSTP